MRCPAPGSESWEPWFAYNDIEVATTFPGMPSASFFHHTGSSSLPDHLLLQSAVARTARGAVDWKLARVVQYIPSTWPRDHVPLTFFVHCNLYPSWSCVHSPVHLSWDFNALASALQHGTGRLEFLAELQGLCQSPEVQVFSKALTRLARATSTGRSGCRWCRVWPGNNLSEASRPITALLSMLTWPKNA